MGEHGKMNLQDREDDGTRIHHGDGSLHSRKAGWAGMGQRQRLANDPSMLERQREIKFPLAEINAHGGGKSERSRLDCEITCIVKVESYLLQSFLTSARK